MTNAQQLITIAGNPNGGDYLLGFRGPYVSPALRYNANAADMQAALCALATVGAGNLRVVKRSSGQLYDVFFQGALADQSVPLLDVDYGGLNRGSVTVSVVTEGAAPPVTPGRRAGPLTVTVSSSAAGYDSDGNPIPTGSLISMQALGIAPGNTSLAFATGGDTDVAEYTVYLPLGSPVLDDDLINVRGKQCRARVREWISPYTGRGGLEVLCRSATGAGGAAAQAGGGPVRGA